MRSRFIVTCALLLIALGGTALAANATVRAIQSFHQQQSQAQTGDVHLLQSWMTIPYIAHTYHIPTSILYQSLQQNPATARHKTLAMIAAKSKRPVKVIIQDAQNTILQYRQQHPFKPQSRPPMTPMPSQMTAKGIEY